MKSLLIVVNYNQDREMKSYLEKIEKFHPKEHIVFVDDGSTDSSLMIAQQLGFRTLQHSTNLGVGAAIRTGILEAREKSYDYVIINSSNGKMRPEDLSTIKSPIENHKADYTTGSRFISGGTSPGLPLFRRLSIPIFSFAMNLLLRRWFSDITCGYRAYKIEWLFQEPIDVNQSWLNRYELEYYIHYWACRKNLRIQEVPVSILYTHLAKNRQSKIRPFKDWWLMIRPIVLLSLGVKK